MNGFYNRYNLSVRPSFSDVKIFWFDGVYPFDILKILIESDYTFDKQEKCWQATLTPKTEKAAKEIIDIAEKLRDGKDSRVEYSFQSIEVRDELEFFNTLNTPEDYKQFLANLNIDKNYIHNLNKEKWDYINSNLRIITDLDDD